MVSNGWLEILSDEDGRAHPFQLTDLGKQLMEKAIPAWDKAQSKARTLLGEDVLGLLDMAIMRIKTPQAK
jgi:hypothetical protein